MHVCITEYVTCLSSTFTLLTFPLTPCTCKPDVKDAQTLCWWPSATVELSNHSIKMRTWKWGELFVERYARCLEDHSI